MNGQRIPSIELSAADEGFCLGGGTSFISLSYISSNDGSKIRKSEISNGYRIDCVLCISV